MASEELQPNQCEEEERVSGRQESESLGVPGDTATTPPQVETAVRDARFNTIANPVSNPLSTYRFSPLPVGSIRLLRLQPHSDEHAPIQCQLFDYPLLGSAKGTHLYEALSYVWGSEEKPQRVSTDEGDLYITENLHAALVRLRDRSFRRIIWADAICINQDDTEERNRQVQSMAEIYSRATRVVVWLEEATVGGRPVKRKATADAHRALEEISSAADGRPAESSNSEANHRAIRTVLRRSWFERIWVLQEVAAARHVLIMSYSMDIDGYAFCAGLNALNLTLEDPNTQSRIRSAAYLIKSAGLRPKHVAGRSNRISLDIRSLGELVDMYHSRKAKDSRDKIYALLGMCSGTPVGLSPNYNISWKDLFRRLVHSLIGEQASVETWDNKEVTVIKSKGCVLGKVSSVSSAGAWDDKQNLDVDIHLKIDSEYLWKWYGRWTLQASAKSIRQGDVVCFLRGASKPTIIRVYEDYCAIVAIAVTPREDDRPEARRFDWPDCSRRIRTFPHEFLLVWDWEISWEGLGYGDDYLHFLNSRVSRHTETDTEDHLGKATRLHDIGLLLRDAEKYEEAVKTLQKAIEAYERTYEIPHPQLLTVDMTHKSQGGLQGKAEKLRVMADVLGRRGDYIEITEYGVVQIAKSFDQELMKLLLDRRGDQIVITEEVVKAAAQNQWSGTEVMELLLDQREDQVLVTKEAVNTIAGLFGWQIVKLLLDQRGDQIVVTEEVVRAAAQNQWNGKEVMKLLLDQRGDQIVITEEVVQIIARQFEGLMMKLLLDRRGDQVVVTEEVVKAAAQNFASGKEVMELLLDRRGDQVVITEELVKAAAGNGGSGKEVMKLLLDRLGDQIVITKEAVNTIVGLFGRPIVKLLVDRRGDQIVVTEEVVASAAENWESGRGVIKLLLDRRGDEIVITEKVVKAAAQNYASGKEVMELLLDRRGDEIVITEQVVKAAAGNGGSGKEVMNLLLDRRGDQIVITEEVVQIIAGRFEGQIMKLLLDQRGKQIVVTEEVVRAAAQNQWNGKEVMKLLLDQRGDQIVVTEEVLKAAAGNKQKGKELMKQLLDRCGDQIVITEEVVMAAAQNRWSGTEVMELLLDQREDQALVTKEAVNTIAGLFGWQIVKLLLDQRGDQIVVTEEVVAAAAGNWKSGKPVMELILHRRGDQIVITEEVVKAAAGNGGSGKEVMKLLLDRRGDQIVITEEVVKAAAGNGGNGKEVMKLLLDRRGDQIVVTEEVVNAAAQNQWSGKEVIALLQVNTPNSK